MTDQALITHINRILALDGDVTSIETPDMAARSFEKVLSLTGSRLLWTVSGEKVTRLAVSDPHDVHTLIEVDVSGGDLANILDMLKNRRYQYPPLEGPEPIVFWGDVPM